MCASFHTVHDYNLGWTDYVYDYHGLPYTDSNFHTEKNFYEPPRVNGDSTSTGAWGCYKWENNIPHIWGFTSYTGYTNARASLPSYDADTPDGTHAATAVERSNPSRPIFAVPQMLYELRELPQLIRWTGEQLLGRKAAGAYLAWNFGAAPLISDLRKLWDFSKHAQRRLEQLQSLFNGGLRRRVTIGSDNLGSGSYGPGLVGFVGGSSTINGKVTWLTTRKRWATVRWEPDSPGIPTPEWLAEKAVDTALGQVDLALIWELMPWSWLIDWCTSIGDFLSATRNAVGAHPTRVCIMTHSQVELSYEITTKPSFVTETNAGQARARFERKRRTVNLTPSLNASLPFLTGKQLGILEALTIQKVPRSLLRGVR